MPNMPNMDMRGGIRGTVRGANKAPVADTMVTAVNAANGARFEAMTDAQGAYSFGALPVGGYNVTVVSAGLTAFRRQGVQVDRRSERARSTSRSTRPRRSRQPMPSGRNCCSRSPSSNSASPTSNRTRCSRSRRRACGGSRYSSTQNGQEHDEPVPGSKPVVTYRRERVYRRQTISEKIEEALADAEEHNVKIGVDAAITTQFAHNDQGRRSGARQPPRLRAGLRRPVLHRRHRAEHGLLCRHRRALSGSPPDAEIPSLTLLNGYTARLVAQNELNLREVWLRTELFGQRLALTTGRLDLTNYFDANAFSNDESTQFLSDALVNNQMLGLSSNGTGVAAEFDPKNGFRFKFGLQQSNNDATNLSDSLFTLSEVGYTFTPFSLPEGSYRLWFRTDNTADDVIAEGRRHQHRPEADERRRPVRALRHAGLRRRRRATTTGAPASASRTASSSTREDTWGIGYAEMKFVRRRS